MCNGLYNELKCFFSMQRYRILPNQPKFLRIIF